VREARLRRGSLRRPAACGGARAGLAGWVAPAFWLALTLTAGATEMPALAFENGGIARPLSAVAGDPARGRAIVADRRKGLCLLCHSGPFPEERFQGDLAPSLVGAGGRASVAQLRARMVDSRRLVPGSLMPPYYASLDLNRVAPQFAGRTILDAQEVEDIVAFLATLKE